MSQYNEIAKRQSAGADDSAQHEGEAICEVTATRKLVTEDSVAPVSPVVSLAVSPASHREKPITEVQGSKPSNKSGNGNTKANCYECKHRRELVGDCHSSCGHPAASPMAAMLFVAGQTEFNIPQIHIRGNAHGVRSGWFIWPMNFDPVWLEICTGYEARK